MKKLSRHRERALASLERRRQEAEEAGDADRLFDVGYELDELGRRAEAVACWQKVVALEPAHGTCWFHLGVAAKEKERWREAIELFDRACELDPDDPSALHCRGHMYQEVGDETRARLDLERAIALYSQLTREQPDDPEVWFWRGAAQARLGEREAALADLARAIDLAASYRDKARNEVDYRPLLDDPAFVQLTARRSARRKTHDG